MTRMKTILPICGLALMFQLCSLAAAAQCPDPSQPGIHVVRKGETLYSISRRYKVPVDDLLRWNKRQKDDVLSECAELWVKAPAAAPSKTPSRPENDRPEETYPERRPTTQPSRPSQPDAARYVKQPGGSHIVAEGQTVAGIARLYGYTEERFREFNNLADSYVARSGDYLRSTDCICPQNTEPSKPANTPTKPTSNPPTDPAPTRPSKASAAYMSSEELAMVDEINLARTNPAGYVRHIEDYIESIRKSKDSSPSITAARELIAELKRMEPVAELRPSECMYRAAKKHGLEQKPSGDVNHQGRDGSWPWDRVLRECPGFTDGNENIVGGPSDVRRAVVLLLVDEGIEGHGHRKNILDPNWRYVACYKVGQVGEVPNSWIQDFGY